jgi:hypothetical protein
VAAGTKQKAEEAAEKRVLHGCLVGAASAELRKIDQRSQRRRVRYLRSVMSTPKSHDAFVSATHEVLFASDDPIRCDVCSEPVVEDDEGCAVAGRGLYMWTRGTEVRFEEPPLCARCASAIGVTAFTRAEIEEEED